MIPLLVIICLSIMILLLFCATVYLNVQFYREKKIFEKECRDAAERISDDSYKQVEQLEQIKLSEELDKSLKVSNITLTEDILNLNYELFDILAKNNLLKK